MKQQNTNNKKSFASSPAYNTKTFPKESLICFQ